MLSRILASFWPKTRSGARALGGFLGATAVLLSLGSSQAQSLNELALGIGMAPSIPLEATFGRYTEMNPLKGYVSTLGRVRACAKGSATEEASTECAEAQRKYIWAAYMPGKDLVFVNLRAPALAPDGTVDLANVVFERDPRVPPVEYSPAAHDAGLRAGQLIRAFLQGPVVEIALADGEYENAIVLDAARVRSLLQQQATLLETEEDRGLTLVNADEFRRQLDAPAIAPSTTHVLIRTTPHPEEAVVALEFPFDPQSVSAGIANIRTVLVSTQVVSRGKVLAESEGQLAYLSDYFSLFSENELKENNIPHSVWKCEPRQTGLGLEAFGFDASQNLRARFDQCASSRIKEVLGPILGAEVSLTTPGGYSDRGCFKFKEFEGCGTNMYDTVGASREDGSYLLLYPFPESTSEIVDVYVKAELAPGNYHRPGSTYMRRQKFVAGNLYGMLQNFLAAPTANKELNFAIDAAYLAGRVEFRNYPLSGATSVPSVGDSYIDVVHTTEAGSVGGTSYDESPPLLPPNAIVNVGDIQRHASLEPDLNHRGLLRKISQPDLLNTDLYIYDCEAAYNPTGAGLTFPKVERRGLKWNELYGIKPNPEASVFQPDPGGEDEDGEPPDPPGPYILQPVPDGEDENGQPRYVARFEPQMMLPHPGQQCIKMYLVNRVTGYLGSAPLTPVDADGRVGSQIEHDRSANEGALAWSNTSDNPAGRVQEVGTVTLAPYLPGPNGERSVTSTAGTALGGWTMALLPPNLRVRAERLNSGIVDDNDNTGNPKPQTVAFEGAGLTDDIIMLYVDWLDHDGKELPKDLPGFSARLSVGRSFFGLSPATGTSATPGDSDSSNVAHFDINPGQNQIKVVLPPDPGNNQHFYLHIGAVSKERCEQDGGRAYKIGDGVGPQLGRSSACQNFAPRSEDRDGALKYRPENYVPFLVPIFDELSTHAAIQDAVTTALEDQAGVIDIPEPIYRYFYRPEYQFSLYELDRRDQDKTTIVTRYDPTSGRAKTSLEEFAVTVRGPNDAPLPSWGPDDRTLLWGVGFGEYLALADGTPHELGCTTERGAICELDDLARLAALTPGGQVGVIDQLSAGFRPEDFLAIQLYSATDAGNVLYRYDLGYPLLVADPFPILLERRADESEMDEFGPARVSDGYVVLPVTLTPTGLPDASPGGFIQAGASVKVEVYDPTNADGPPLGAPLFQGLAPMGPYGVVITYEDIRERLLLAGTTLTHGDVDQRPFLLRISARTLSEGVVAVTTTTAPGNTFGPTHVVEYPGRLKKTKSGAPVGQVIAHNVNLTDGSLTLSRTDFSIPGAGPNLELVRGYSNLSEDQNGVLGPGWSHNLEYRLTVLSQDDAVPDELGRALIPSWVKQNRGFVRWENISSHVHGVDGAPFTKVYVNGTTFTRTEGVWRPEPGRFAKLEQLAGACPDTAAEPEGGDGPGGSEAPASGCFRFTSRDGTEYYYPSPSTAALGTPPVLGTRTSLSIDSQLPYRVGYGLPNGQPSFTPGTIGDVRTRSSHVLYVKDRFGQRLTFDYDAQGRLSTLTDHGAPSGDRSCTFNYSDGLAACRPRSNQGRLYSVSCLGPDDRIEVTFCYDGDGYLKSAKRGELTEEYDYVKAPGASGCDTQTGSGTGNGTGSGGASSGSGGTGSGSGVGRPTVDIPPLPPLNENARSGDTLATLEQATPLASVGGATPDTITALACSKNLESFTSDTATTSFHYASGAVQLGFPLLVERPAHEVVDEVTYPSTIVGYSGEVGAVVGVSDHATIPLDYRADRTRTVGAMRSEDGALTYELDETGRLRSVTEPIGPGSKVTTETWDSETGQLMARKVEGPKLTIESSYEYEAIDGIQTGNVTDEDTSYSPGPSSHIELTYDRFGLPKTRTEHRGPVTLHESWTYDARGFVTSYTDKTGVVRHYTPDSEFAGRLGVETLTVDGQEVLVSYEYDAYGNLEQISRGAVHLFTYRNSRGEITDEYDANRNRTHYTYDANGRLETVELPTPTTLGEGQSLTQPSITYAGLHTVTSVDRNGVSWIYRYSPRNDLVQIERSVPGGELSARKYMAYDLAGHLVRESDWNGHWSSYEANAIGGRISMQKRDGTEIQYQDLDLLGNAWTVVDEEGVITRRTFDALGRELTSHRQCQDTACNPTTSRYDLTPTASGAAYAVEYLDERGQTARTEFDGEGRAVVVRRAGAQSESSYNEEGRLIRTKDAEGLCQAGRYDAEGRLVARLIDGQTCDGVGFLTRYEPDLNGNVLVEHSFPDDVLPTRTLADQTPGTAQIVRTFDAWDRLDTERAPVVRNARDDLESYNDRVVTHRYDALDGLVEVTDLNGAVARWQRNQLGWVVRHTDPGYASGSEKGQFAGECQATLCNLDFDLNGNVTRQMDGRGVETQFTYDAEERTSTTIEAANISSPPNEPPLRRVLSVTSRDGFGNPLQVTRTFPRGPDGVVTTGFTYNDRGLLASETILSPDGNFTRTLTYQAGGLPDTEEVARNGKSFLRKVTFDVHNHLDHEYYPTAATLQSDAEYDRVGNLVSITNRRQAKTTATRDEFLRNTAVSVEGPQVASQTLLTVSYNALGLPVTETDARGFATRHVYDSRGRRVRTIAPGPSSESEQERTQSTFYDAMGNVTSVEAMTRSDEAGYITSYTYDPASRLISSSNTGETSHFSYDVNGNRRTVTNPRGFTTISEYDALNRLKSVRDAENNLTSYVYDPLDNLEETRTPNATTSFRYDELGVRKSLSMPGGVTAFSNPDPLGNSRTMVDAKGQVYSFDFDHFGRRVDAVYPNSGEVEARTIHTDFDDVLNRVTVTETKSTGIEVSVLEHNPIRDFLERVTQRGLVTTYQYDAAGNRTQVTSPSGTTAYTYDERNRVHTAQADTSGAVIFDYYPDGRPDLVTYPNGVRDDYDYYPERRVHSIAIRGLAEIASVTYDYDDNGNRSWQNEARGNTAELTTYSYDRADRLTSFRMGVEKEVSYEFDGYNRDTEEVTLAPGQPGQQVVARKGYSYDANNRLSSIIDNVSGDTTVYDYDDNGNTVSRDVSSAPEERLEFHYDSRDQMTRAIRGPPGLGEEVGRYSYNSDGLRIRSESPAETAVRQAIEYYYDGSSVLEERSASTSDLISRYHYGPQGALAQDDHSAGLPNRRFYHSDGLGSPTHLTDATTGDVAAEYKIDPWGAPRDTTSLTTSTNRKLFTGHEYDTGTGLYYAKARFYDPSSGRFLTQDTFLGDTSEPASLHRYNYAGSDPVNYVDPTGHKRIKLPGGGEGYRDEKTGKIWRCRDRNGMTVCDIPYNPPKGGEKQSGGGGGGSGSGSTAPSDTPGGGGESGGDADQQPPDPDASSAPDSGPGAPGGKDPVGSNGASQAGSLAGAQGGTRQGVDSLGRVGWRGKGPRSLGTTPYQVTGEDRSGRTSNPEYSGNFIPGEPGDYAPPPFESFASTAITQRDAERAAKMRAFFAGFVNSVGSAALVAGVTAAAIAVVGAPIALTTIGVVAAGLGIVSAVNEVASGFQGSKEWLGAMGRIFTGEGTNADYGVLGSTVGSAMPVGGAGAWVGARYGSAATSFVKKKLSGLLSRLKRGPQCRGRVCSGPGSCFVSGTLVRTPTGKAAIETLRVGMRVISDDGEAAGATAVDESWRAVELTMPNPLSPDDLVDVVLLRSPEWIAQAGAVEGEQIWLALPEIGLEGWARVNSIRGPPPLEEGPGRVVLATVTHINNEIYELRFLDQDEPLRPTGTHRLYSEDRADWTLTRDLIPGETLRTSTGTVVLQSIRRLPGAERVFNIEVETEHTYYVSSSEVLSHNICPDEPVPGKAAGAGANAYSVAFETTIAKAGAGSRGAHFKAANEALLAEMKANPQLAQAIEGLGVKVPTSSTGAALGKSPSGWTWHHVPDQPGAMQLVPRAQHQGSAWQPLFHPGGVGGFKLWGADF